MPTDLVVAKLDTARRALMEAKTIQETKNVLGVKGVYVIFEGDDILYIGASKNIGKRLARHELAYFFVFDDIHVKYIEDKDPFVLEDILIKALRPKLNSTGFSKRYFYLLNKKGISPEVDDPVTNRLVNIVDMLRKLAEGSNE